MIVAGLSEEKILEELIFDREVVANEAKKLAKKVVARLHKEGRDGVNENHDFIYDIKTAPLNNNWNCVFTVNMQKKPYWQHFASCMVETERGTQDFYLVRGFSVNKPYYIKISSHALKRFRERGVEEKFGVELEYSGVHFAPMIVRKGEFITWMKITDPKLLAFVLDSEDSYLITNLFYTLYGCYIGYETEKGNYEFNTFLSNEKKLMKLGEDHAMQLCKYAHIALNPSFYNKKLIERLNSDGLQDLVGVYPYKLLP